MKPCRRCGEVKPLDQFYWHPQMADGHLNVCMVCVKTREKLRRTANLERIQAYDRERGRLPHRKEANKKRASRYIGKYPPLKVTHPEKRHAHIIVGNAIRDGKLKVKPCERCGYGIGIQAHHEDYMQPLKVNWLCKQHHREHHAKARGTA